VSNQYDENGPILDSETGEIIAVEPTGGLQPVITAEINQAVATAHKYPRRRDQEIINEITGRATLDEDIAAECSYSLKRGNKQITGPSIRFAEIVRASYGNIRVASRFVALDMADPERAAVIVEAVALDLQMNQAEIIPNRRSIMTSGTNGRKPQIYSADMINMTVNAASSIARRNAILSVVPKVLWQGGYQRVIKVLMGNADTLIQRREKMIEAFARFDVTPEALFQALGVVNVSEIKVDHMPAMVGMLTAIKDGEQIDSVLGRGGVTERPKFQGAGNVLKDTPDQVSETIAKNADEATQGAQAAAAARAAPKEEAKSEPRRTAVNPDDRFNGDAKDFASADFVISRSGKILKDRGEQPKFIIDQRFDRGDSGKDDLFSSYDEWTGICTSNSVATELGQEWKQPDVQGSEDDAVRSQGSQPDGDERPAGAADEPAKTADTRQRAPETSASSKPAASRGAAPPPKGLTFDGPEGYISHMRDTFDRATSKTAINEAWNGTREDRKELLGLDEIDALTKERDDALKRFARA